MRALMTTFALALSAGALIAASPSTTSGDAQGGRRSRSGDECFNARLVNNFRPVNRDQVDVYVTASRVYRLDLGPGCFDIDWADRIALRSRTGSFICGALDAEIVAPSSFGRGRDRCVVTGLRRLSDAEVLASRGRRRH